MHSSIQHELDSPRDAVELALRSSDLGTVFGEVWDAVSAVETLHHQASAEHIERVWRCQAKAPLKVLSGYEITRDMMTWEEHWAYEVADHRGQWHIVPRPGVDPDASWRRHFEMKGSYQLDPLADGRCRRTVEVDLRIDLKVIGKVVERIAMAELRKAFDAEATVLAKLVSLP